MKRSKRTIFIIIISLVIALTSAAGTYITWHSSREYSTTAALFLQITPSPQVDEDRSEIGSTDGIVIMGGVIVAVVLLPILLQRKKWMQPE